MPLTPSVSASKSFAVDIIIVGGGVAGLWTLHTLERAGYTCLLVEKTALGSGQTIASQGIIHGGIKYALTGEANAASKAVADMPARWHDCLSARGGCEVDLRSVHVLSPRQYLWTTASLASRLAGVAASKAIRTHVDALDHAHVPPAFTNAPKGVHVYSVEEPVLDPRSLIAAMIAGRAAQIALGESNEQGELKIDTFTPSNAKQPHIRVRLAGNVTVTAPHAVFTAGKGNAALLSAIGQSTAAQQQLRPLHMVMARGERGAASLANQPPIFGHCVHLGDKPRLTITTQPDAEGRTVWYIGGLIAEKGVDLDPPALIALAKAELAACLPWLDTSKLQYSTLRVDRAEARTAEGRRPDGPVITAAGQAIVAWPTKLALAPLTAAQILSTIKSQGVKPDHRCAQSVIDTPRLVAPPIAPLPWDEKDRTWT